MLGFQTIRRIGISVVAVFLLLNLLLRDTATPALKAGLGYAFILASVALLILLYLNRYRP